MTTQFYELSLGTSDTAYARLCGQYTTLEAAELRATVLSREFKDVFIGVWKGYDCLDTYQNGKAL